MPKSRRKKQRGNPRATDCHHIFYQRRYWGGVLKELRQFDYCRLQIPKDTLHKQIHAKITNVPTPKAFNAREALVHLKLLEKQGAISDKDDLERRLVVLIALFDCAEPATTEALRKQLEIVRDYYKKPH